jgi:hypothetical protein
MTNPDDLVNEAAESEDPMRTFGLLLAADLLEAVCTDGSTEVIRGHIEAVISAADRRLILEPILLHWIGYEPTVQ